MPGESLQRDLAEVFEYWGEPERLGIPSWEIARYVTTSLVALTDAFRALPESIRDETGTERNAGPVADESASSVGAQASLHFVDPKGVGGSHG